MKNGKTVVNRLFNTQQMPGWFFIRCYFAPSLHAHPGVVVPLLFVSLWGLLPHVNLNICTKDLCEWIVNPSLLSSSRLLSFWVVLNVFCIVWFERSEMTTNAIYSRLCQSRCGFYMGVSYDCVNERDNTFIGASRLGTSLITSHNTFQWYGKQQGQII